MFGGFSINQLITYSTRKANRVAIMNDLFVTEAWSCSRHLGELFHHLIIVDSKKGHRDMASD